LAPPEDLRCMYMAYSKNPHLPRVRMQAVLLVRSGWSIRKTARHLGFHHTAVMRWLRRAPEDGRMVLPTRSSRPHHSPQAIPKETVGAIIETRKTLRRCSEVVHASLAVPVSLSTVKRTLKRYGMLKRRSRWARYRRNIPRPFAEKPGDLVQIDTIHIQKPDGSRVYVFTLLDVVSRWGYAKVLKRVTASSSIRFITEAQRKSPFVFKTLQSDHGPEFTKFFRDWVMRHAMAHRHSRVRRPNDNAHVERFNRTIQEECLYGIFYRRYPVAIRRYIEFYNSRRLHLGIKLKTPLEVVLRS
jgi:transposase InsO family protein